MLRALVIFVLGTAAATLSQKAPVATEAPPSSPAATQAPPSSAPNPTRDPHTAGYVQAKDLRDGALPPLADGNYILGPTHNPAPETIFNPTVPQGTVYEFTMRSEDSKFFPGIARDPNTFGTADPADPAKMLVPTSHPAPYLRHVAVYVPKQYVPGTPAPFIVGADGIDYGLFTLLNNLIAAGKIPAMIAISIGNGGGDAQGSERGLEYDTVSGKYAEWVEAEVLPEVEHDYGVRLTRDPEGRATMGNSSGGACAFAMAWFHPEWYHRVLTFSGTYANQQWPHSDATPHGAWGFHETLIPNSPRKPLRIWLEVGDRDTYNSKILRGNMHDTVVAHESMARVLAAKSYHYQMVFARNAGHTDRPTRSQLIPEALEYIWEDYKPVQH